MGGRGSSPATRPAQPPTVDAPQAAAGQRRSAQTCREATAATAQAQKRKKHKSKAQQLEQAIQQLSEDYLPRLQKYEAQARALAGRNSYAKTDPEATFMRMKEDPMGNGQLKAGYNVQIGTEHQFVLGFSVHQSPGDPGCLIPHLKQTKQQLGRLPRQYRGRQRLWQ